MEPPLPKPLPTPRPAPVHGGPRHPRPGAAISLAAGPVTVGQLWPGLGADRGKSFLSRGPPLCLHNTDVSSAPASGSINKMESLAQPRSEYVGPYTAAKGNPHLLGNALKRIRWTYDSVPTWAQGDAVDAWVDGEWVPGVIARLKGTTVYIRVECRLGLLMNPVIRRPQRMRSNKRAILGPTNGRRPRRKRRKPQLLNPIDFKEPRPLLKAPLENHACSNARIPSSRRSKCKAVVAENGAVAMRRCRQNRTTEPCAMAVRAPRKRGSAPSSAAQHSTGKRAKKVPCTSLSKERAQQARAVLSAFEFCTPPPPDKRQNGLRPLSRCNVVRVSSLAAAVAAGWDTPGTDGGSREDVFANDMNTEELSAPELVSAFCTMVRGLVNTTRVPAEPYAEWVVALLRRAMRGPPGLASRVASLVGRLHADFPVNLRLCLRNMAEIAGRAVSLALRAEDGHSAERAGGAPGRLLAPLATLNCVLQMCSRTPGAVDALLATATAGGMLGGNAGLSAASAAAWLGERLSNIRCTPASRSGLVALAVDSVLESLGESFKD